MNIIKLKIRKLNFFESILGLIGVNEITPVFFKTRFGIHTFGVKTPIDILILNKEGQVVYLKENMVPNRFLFWNPNFNQVIELPENTIKVLKIKINSKIVF